MQGVITQISQLTHDVKSFHIHVPERPAFLPGQYLILGLEAQGAFHERSYSIASPNHWENVEILVKLHPGGKLTPELFDKQVGHPVDVQMPYGMFKLYDDNIPANMVFIAGGVGLAPLLSMIRHLEWKGHQGGKTLIYGNRTPYDIVHKDELNRLAKSGQLKLVYTVDNAEDSWEGEQGLITPEMIDQHCDVEESHFYICGPPMMVDGMVENLGSLHVPHDRINHERW
ncbi:FAD-dependent oxidoreductase [Candidatus Woesearchaeota archaeon]|nr:FAD-dependent oxidoreductase [Candidatus Woesearchaeota archaeon]